MGGLGTPAEPPSNIVHPLIPNGRLRSRLVAVPHVGYAQLVAGTVLRVQAMVKFRKCDNTV